MVGRRGKETCVSGTPRQGHVRAGAASRQALPGLTPAGSLAADGRESQHPKLRFAALSRLLTAVIRVRVIWLT